MKYRPQRGGLAESMAEVVEIPPTREALATVLQVLPSQVTVEEYCWDGRIGWDTHLVSIEGLVAIGFTDGPLIDSLVGL